MSNERRGEGLSSVHRARVRVSSVNVEGQVPAVHRTAARVCVLGEAGGAGRQTGC